MRTSLVVVEDSVIFTTKDRNRSTIVLFDDEYLAVSKMGNEGTFQVKTSNPGPPTNSKMTTLAVQMITRGNETTTTTPTSLKFASTLLMEVSRVQAQDMKVLLLVVRPPHHKSVVLHLHHKSGVLCHHHKSTITAITTPALTITHLGNR
mmetsp:Transcript_14348/g.34989  ORF Transcript_14348/g.34989 Transcript_14348/m.34989 type:complete len:149 (-) Transcript_14348:539-985(-)